MTVIGAGVRPVEEPDVLAGGCPAGAPAVAGMLVAAAGVSVTLGTAAGFAWLVEPPAERGTAGIRPMGRGLAAG